MKVLVAGWFSFERMGASAGDLLCRDAVCDWLRAAGAEVLVANAPPFKGGVDWTIVDPLSVDAVVFVCGPFGNGWPVTGFLARFEGRRLVGVNLTMLQELSQWNPFDVLLERDSSRTCRPDAAFLTEPRRVPVAGLILVHPQKEYGAAGRHEQANQALRALARSRGMAAVEIDTRLDTNQTGLTTPAQVESLIARMDVVLTTRLHGMVLALKSGVPCLAVDPIAGGAKISRQAAAIGWPHVFQSDALDPARLQQSFDACLTSETRSLAQETARRARALLAGYPAAIVDAVAVPVRK